MNFVDPALPHPWRVAAVSRELADTVTLEIAPVAGPTPSYVSGQFNMLYVFGVGEAAISLSGNPARRGRYTHTVRGVGAVSRALASMETGDTVGVRGPLGRGWPLAAARGGDFVLVAGGLGLAPLRPVIYEVLAQRKSFGRVSVLVGSRHPEDILYRGELERWQADRDLDVQITVDHAEAGWRGSVGVVPALVPQVDVDWGNAMAFVCGPEIMMRYTVTALREVGMDDERIYLSLERNMKCGVGLCGHCQLGPVLVCRDGPVVRLDSIANLLGMREL